MARLGETTGRALLLKDARKKNKRKRVGPVTDAMAIVSKDSRKPNAKRVLSNTAKARDAVKALNAANRTRKSGAPLAGIRRKSLGEFFDRATMDQIPRHNSRIANALNKLLKDK